jgi:arylsulfatase A-like enzyme
VLEEWRRLPAAGLTAPLPRWIARGAVAGAPLALWEVLFAALSGYNLPLSYLLLVLAFDLAGCVLPAVAVAGGLRLLRLPWGGDFATAFPPLAAVTFLLFLLDKVVVAARFRGLSVPAALLAFAALLLAGCAVAPRLLRRLCRSPHTEPSLLVSLFLLSLWLVGGRHLTRTLLPSYLSPAGLTANLLLAALLGGLLLLGDRLLARCRPRLAPRAGSLALSSLLGTLLLTLLVGSASRASEPTWETAAAPAARPQLPNVILITLDTLRSDRLSLYGYSRPTDPRLRAFARQAQVYEKALSPSSWTLPAHASIFTGTLPRRHGADHAGPAEPLPIHPLHPKNLTLAEILRDHGYRTAGIVANHGLLNRDFGMDQGFDLFDARPKRLFSYLPAVHSWIGWLAPHPYECLTKSYRPAEEITESALRWIHQNRTGPFFLFINYLDPHSPYCPPAPFDRMFPGKRWDIANPLKEINLGRRQPTPAEAAHFAALYDGEIAYLDRQLGTLLDELKRLDLYDDALIVVTSDHGEFFGEHSLWEHGYGPYEEVYRVPLLIRYPGGSPAGREAGTVSTVQILPTILQRLAVPAPQPLDAAALTSSGQSVVAEQYVSKLFWDLFGDRFGRAFDVSYEWPWKLVLYSDGARDLFDLAADPTERRDLESLHPEVADAMSARLLRYLETVEPVRPVGDGSAEIDSALRRRLKALGYLR